MIGEPLSAAPRRRPMPSPVVNIVPEEIMASTPTASTTECGGMSSAWVTLSGAARRVTLKGLFTGHSASRSSQPARFLLGQSPGWQQRRSYWLAHRHRGTNAASLAACSAHRVALVPVVIADLTSTSNNLAGSAVTKKEIMMATPAHQYLSWIAALSR